VRVDRHIVLIGLPGAGKTSVGRQLARVLERPFADADEQLELSVGCTIPQLFQERGESELHRLEADLLAELLGRDYPLVVSAPGAAHIGAENRALLAESAVVFWIHGSVRFLTELSDPAHRPRVVDSHEEALVRLEGELSALYAEVADEVVDIERFHSVGGEPKQLIAHHIVELLAAGDLPGPVHLPTHGPRVVDRPEDASGLSDRVLSDLYEEVADRVVDIEPFHAREGEPEPATSQHIAELSAPGTTDADAAE
jgi:shikimate kinase